MNKVNSQHNEHSYKDFEIQELLEAVAEIDKENISIMNKERKILHLEKEQENQIEYLINILK